MKRIKIASLEFICSLMGHKWDIGYIYGASAVGKCKRCKKHQHDLLSEFL
jgi:hypothetical protein